MFSATIKSDTLKSIVNVVSTLLDEAKFDITPEGMYLKAVNPAHISMVDLAVGAGAFESYSADGCEVALELDKIKGILKLAGPGDVIQMDLNDTQSKMVFRVGNITRSMNLIDTSGFTSPNIHTLDLPNKIDVLVDHIQKGIKAAESISSDHFTMKADVDSFEVYCEGDTDSSTLRLEGKDVSLSVEGPVMSQYPLEDFSNMVKAIPSGTVINIELEKDYPMRINFGLSDGKVTVSYLLAPRVENY